VRCVTTPPPGPWCRPGRGSGAPPDALVARGAVATRSADRPQRRGRPSLPPRHGRTYKPPNLATPTEPDFSGRTPMDFVAARQTMVDSQVRTNDVTDRALQAALLATPRETLCPKDKAFAAYAEIEVELGAGRRLMIPRDVSKLLQAVEARPGERALAIGGPYAAAVLAAMGLEVTAQEAEADRK